MCWGDAISLSVSCPFIVHCQADYIFTASEVDLLWINSPNTGCLITLLLRICVKNVWSVFGLAGDVRHHKQTNT